MWDIPRLGAEPMSPALASDFTTETPEKPHIFIFFNIYFTYLAALGLAVALKLLVLVCGIYL